MEEWNEDIALDTGLLLAEGLIEQIGEDEESGFAITDKGYEKGRVLWMANSGQDRLLLTLFLRRLCLI